MTMSNNKKLLILLLVLILIFIWGNSLLSKEVSGAISDFIQYNIFGFSGGGTGGDVNSTPIRKLAHFMEFAALGMVLFMLFSKKAAKCAKAFAFSAAAACTDETIQIFSHRGNSIKDVALDCCGAAFGIFVIWLIFVICKRRKKKCDKD